MDDKKRERFRRIDELFQRVCDLDEVEQSRVLDEACADDPELRAEVERLLAADRPEAGDLTELVGGVAADLATGESAVDRTGRRIGPYRILETLGHGGMGVVYRAVRDDDEYRKEVAIKVVSPVRVGEQWIRRFREERSILARLDHPNIARLLDGGSSEDGLPYVVMDFVEGQPIDRWCEAQQLDLDARIEVFREVCAAVQEAHRNLVVHRDLKPANVLVGTDGRPRLLDFGIAKLIAPDTDEAGAAPPTATRMMTPDYASPEQVQGRPVTTASDVYSLGVLLYELLTGVRPYRLEGASATEIERLVCEVDPPLPSAALPEQGTTTGTTSSRRRLRGDLDRIVAVAMHKDPKRRYASAQALSDDLQRFLAGLPVTAQEDTWGYRSRKFVRRHRFGVAVAVIGVAVLATFGIVMARQSARLAAERDRVELERAKAQEVADYVTGLFRTSDESGVPGRDLPAHVLLARGVERLDRLDDQPLIQAELMETIGDIYLFLDLIDEAEPLVRESLVLREANGADPLDLASSHHELGKLAYLQGDFNGALEAYTRGLEIREPIVGRSSMEVAGSLSAIAATHRYLNNQEEALVAYEEAVAIMRELGRDEGEGDFDALVGSLAGTYRALGRFDEAEAMFRELLERARRLYGERHIATAEAASSLASLLRASDGDPEEADPLYRLAIEIRREAFGRHTHTAQALNNYGVFLRDIGREDEARPLHYEALEMYREVHGDNHPDVGLALTNVATWEARFGDAGKAFEMYERSAATFANTVGQGHWLYWTARYGGAQALRTLGREDEALERWHEAVDGYIASMGKDHGRTVRAANNLAEWLRELGRDGEADAVLAKIDG